MPTALLFVNGEPPKCLPKELTAYQYIACTDGAYHNYLQSTQILPHFIIGDLDSLHDSPINANIEIVHTPDQSKTDFEKAILFLATKGVTNFVIYGASGQASDHFLGNLSVAMQYYKQFKLTFYDDFCRFFFATQKMSLNHVYHSTISLIPLSPVDDLTVTGCQYPLTHSNLKMGELISLRNKAIEDQVTIEFSRGDLLVLITH